jgi:hypothetical protein
VVPASFTIRCTALDPNIFRDILDDGGGTCYPCLLRIQRFKIFYTKRRLNSIVVAQINMVNFGMVQGVTKRSGKQDLQPRLCVTGFQWESIVIQISPWHIGPHIIPIDQRDSHTSIQMRLDMAMEQERPGVHDLIAIHNPGIHAWQHGERGVCIANWRIDEVKVVRHNLHRFSHRGKGPAANAGANHVEFIGMLV